MEEGEVVGVAGHFGDVILRRDEAWVGKGREVEEEVGEQDRDGASYFVDAGELRPDGREVEVLGDGEEGEEEDLGTD